MKTLIKRKKRQACLSMLNCEKRLNLFEYAKREVFGRNQK